MGNRQVSLTTDVHFPQPLAILPIHSPLCKTEFFPASPWKVTDVNVIRATQSFPLLEMPSVYAAYGNFEVPQELCRSTGARHVPSDHHHHTILLILLKAHYVLSSILRASNLCAANERNHFTGYLASLEHCMDMETEAQKVL